MNPGYPIAVLAASLYGTADFLGGWASRRVSALTVTFASGVPGLVTLLLAWPFAGGAPAPRDLAWGMAAGVFGSLGVALLYRAFAIGPVSVAAPLISLIALSLPVLVGVLLGERPSGLALAGIALAGGAFPLLSRTADDDPDPAAVTGAHVPAATSDARIPPDGEAQATGVAVHGRGAAPARPDAPPPAPRSTRARPSRRSVVPIAMLAGVLVGGFLVAIGQVGADAGLAPLVVARVTMLALFAAILLARRRGPWPAGAVAATAAAGAIDSLANIAYFVAVHRGTLAIVATIVSLSPAATVLLARVVLHERWSVAQRAGLALAAAAIVCVSLG